jgi:single-stranded DNA-binding protein
MDLNQCTLGGRLVDAVIFTKGKKEDGSDDRAWGKLAVNREGKDVPCDFFPFVAWGARARVLSKWGEKGRTVVLTGKLRTNNKKLPDNRYENYTELQVREVVLGQYPRSKQQAESPTSPAATPEMAALAAAILGAAKKGAAG